MPGKISGCVTAYTDNSAAIDIIKSHGVTGRSRHFERWCHYVRDLQRRFLVDVRHLPTDEMPADLFTKALHHEAYTRHRSFLLGN